MYFGDCKQDYDQLFVALEIFNLVAIQIQLKTYSFLNTRISKLKKLLE